MQIAWHGAPSPGFSKIQTAHFCPAVCAWPAGVLGFGAVQAASIAPAAISNKTGRARPAVCFMLKIL
jgi:hypothetical protein